MWKPYIPSYLPCRQATSEEQNTLEAYLLRDMKRDADYFVNTASDLETTAGDDPIMEYEGASHEVFALVLDSILVVFDWQYFQTSQLVPRHDGSQQLAKVMGVFWHGKPDHAEWFTWEHDGSFHRLVSPYQPEDKLKALEWQTTEYLL